MIIAALMFATFQRPVKMCCSSFLGNTVLLASSDISLSQMVGSCGDANSVNKKFIVEKKKQL